MSAVSTKREGVERSAGRLFRSGFTVEGIMLRALLAERDAARAERDAREADAFRRGAEAMRGKAATITFCAGVEESADALTAITNMRAAIRALPLPEAPHD